MKRNRVAFHVEPLDRRLLLAATPVPLKEFQVSTRGSYPREYAAVGATVFFIASDDPFNHDDLWKTDGTVAGTVRVKDFGPRDGRLGYRLSEPTAVGGRVFFSAPDYGGGNQELWVSDGTEAGTHRVTQIAPGDAGSSPFSLVNFNGALYFSAESPDAGRELWTSDGTEA